jgi:cytochrome c-type biogenesis protein CcmH
MHYLFFLVFSLNIFAEAIDTHTFDNPVLQKRYNILIKDIRCPVCQGQSIGGSNAPLAQDLREITATMLREGRSDNEIFTFMTDRYGDFASFKPPINYTTYLLWLGPFIFIIIVLFMFLSKKSNRDENKIDAEKLKQAEDLLS